MSRLLSLLLATAFLVGCGGSRTPVGPAPGPVPPGIQTTNGLAGPERTRWHHLAEGSEVYPLSWLLALTDPDTNKPFLDNPERFGLLADPDRGADNLYGLPVGLTADFTRDLRFVGVRMIGINCAACHVNELHREGQPVVRLDGAPNLFDLQLFYGELARATKATFSDPFKAWAFLRRLSQAPSATGPAPLAAAPANTRAALDTYKDLDALKQAGPLEKELAERIEKIHKQEVERPAADLRKGLKTATTDEPLRRQAERVRAGGLAKNEDLPADARAAARALLSKTIGPVDVGPTADAAAKEPAPNSPWATLTVPARASAIGDTLSHFAETIRLLKARAAFLLSLGSQNGTRSGAGRVDAFGGARNLIFGQNLPLDAPISYPHLWNLSQIKWLHWDANTTSLLERNVGQALGLGAVFDPDTGDSTVNVGHLDELETLARKIRPPIWPEDPAAFGPIDAAKRDAGRALFKQHCQTCHQDLPANGDMGDSRMALAAIGTDPRRATNFARPVNGQLFNVALSNALKNVARKAGGSVSTDNEWRITQEYANRPLVASWATAPYLHNNSVPTIYDLLLPADERPKKFAVGSREYDTKKLGYKTEGAGPAFVFDTSQPGNSNAGHSGPQFGTDLNETQRMEVLEYLKSIR